jgi:CO/xanthine dehydrogenase FAD-binding subunit
MKPAPFDYVAADSLAGALELLDSDDAVALAGGQSLIPMMNFRLARPAVLVDLNPVAELAGIGLTGDALRLGALTRQASVERSRLILKGWPLLVEAVRLSGHPATRSRGTVGGSVAHADPRAELPVALLALDGTVRLRSLAGERSLAIPQLLRGPLMTSLAAGELICELEVPAAPPTARMAFSEFARTHGGFALAGAAVVYAPGEHAAIALLGAAPVPTRAAAAEQALRDGASATETIELAVTAVADGHRRALLAAVLGQALGRVLA